jgi:hypothetical protein
MCEVEEMIDEFCEFCDMDPAECYNIGRCLMEKDEG